MRRLAYFTMLTRSISTKFHELSVSTDFDRDIVDGLISAFTRERKSSCHPGGNDLLMPPGVRLTPEIVESVLKGIRSWTYALDFFHWASTQNEYRHSCYTYNAMASILSNARQNAPLKNLLLTILNSRCSMTPGALGFFIRCLASVGLVEEANMYFDLVRSMGLCVPNNYSYNCLLEAISKTNWAGLAEMRMNEMRSMGWEVDKYTLTPLLKVYCNAGEFQKALDVSNHMYEQGWFDVHLLSICALSLSKRGKVDEAFELIERMEGLNVRLNEKTFYVLIHGFISGSRVDRALALLYKMRGSGFRPDVSIYDVLIGQLCKSKEFKKALSLYFEMKDSGIFPDVGILAKLISSAPEEGMILLLFEDGWKILNGKSLIILYNTVLNCLVDVGAVDKAYQLIRITIGLDPDSSDINLKELLAVREDFRPNTASFHIVINGLFRAGKLGEALYLFRDMDQGSCRRDVLLYNNMIDAMCASNRLTESLELLTEMKDSGFQPTQFTHNTIYGCFCRLGDQVGALNMVKEMRLYAFEPWIKHTTSLIQHLFKRGKGVEACNYLSDMVKEGARPDIVPYSAALEGLLKLREVDRALALFQEICGSGKRPDVVAYNILINGLCKAKRLQEAEKFLSEMLANTLVPSAVTYNSLIDGWCKHGNVDLALAFFHEMTEVGPNVVTYTTLIDGLCNAGFPDDAVVMWDEMQRKGCFPNRVAFMAFINGLCKNGMPDVGLSYLHQMSEQKLQADNYVYTTLLGAFLLKSNAVLAFDVLKEMVDKEVVFPNASDKNFSVLKDVISRLCEDPETSSNMQSLIESGAIPSGLCSRES